jgi:hypothetical protein
MEFYFLNWIQLSYDFGKVVPSGITQGKVCCKPFFALKQNLIAWYEKIDSYFQELGLKHNNIEYNLM